MQGDVGVDEHAHEENSQCVEGHVSSEGVQKVFLCQQGNQWDGQQYQKHGIQVDGMYEMPHVGIP